MNLFAQTLALSVGGIIGIVVGVAVPLLLIVWIVGFYNKIRTMQNNIEGNFAQIDVVLKRRYDLIPNLVETVKGYTKHESQLLTDIVEARMKGASATTEGDKIEAANQMTKALGGINLLVEQYPQLQASANFVELQRELSETENKISVFRQFYNDGILIYNRHIAKFPNMILAKLFGFNKRSYLEAAAEEREVVKVSF